jgi:hypothetical protein
VRPTHSGAYRFVQTILPLARTGGWKALGKAHSFMISESGKGLDVTAVAIPATLDDMVIDVWVAPHEVFNRLTKRDLFGAQIEKRAVGPNSWMRERG